MDRKPKIDRQREHQANERTFLAWLRTSIALIGFGFAIARFGLFLRELQSAVTGQNTANHSIIDSENIGLILVAIGITLIPLSAWRYNQVLQRIENSNYQPSRFMVFFTAAIVMVLGLLSIPLVMFRKSSVPVKPSPAQELKINRDK